MTTDADREAARAIYRSPEFRSSVDPIGVLAERIGLIRQAAARETRAEIVKCETPMPFDWQSAFAADYSANVVYSSLLQPHLTPQIDCKLVLIQMPSGTIIEGDLSREKGGYVVSTYTSTEWEEQEIPGIQHHCDGVYGLIAEVMQRVIGEHAAHALRPGSEESND